jgi:glucose dehydrogenase
VRAAFDVIAPPVVGGGAVYVTDLIGHTRALDASDGRQRWDFALNAPTFRGVPILIGDHLLVPTIEGALAAIDAATGELVWRMPADGSAMRALASTADTVVAVRGGARSGIDAFEHDPDAELVREASPTTLDVGRMVGAMAIAGIGVIAVVLLVGRWLASRMGPAFPDDGEPDPGIGEDEPIRDPWEEEGGSS